tara:strand:- start:359 stop:784 length:426 start_codon:yes stop_codon:yes gene_type:complete
MNNKSEYWGPHYWFFLQTVAETYPKYPNDVTKKKFYELIINMPLFIPEEKIGNEFAKILDKYPVTPYLDNRDSFKKWIHFIHNKINQKLGKKPISYAYSRKKYMDNFKPKVVYLHEKLKVNKNYLYSSFIIFGILILLFNQ